MKPLPKIVSALLIPNTKAVGLVWWFVVQLAADRGGRRSAADVSSRSASGADDSAASEIDILHAQRRPNTYLTHSDDRNNMFRRFIGATGRRNSWYIFNTLKCDANNIYLIAQSDYDTRDYSAAFPRVF